MATHHSLDVKPIPESVLYINEPELADITAYDAYTDNAPDAAADNVRVYVPLDLNRAAIIRGLTEVFIRYGEPTEDNEFALATAVQQIIAQLEIYDQVWYTREGSPEDGHSQRGIQVVKDMIKILEDNEGCGETFPYDVIEKLREEYL